MTTTTAGPSSSATSSPSMFSRTTTFDLVSRKKAPQSQLFWVHKDNLNELMFYLLKEFKLISDDSGLVDDDENEDDSEERRGEEC
ncbi:unnamed protein product [Ambrosiozyma monospora]|uniref:Unnamed protein product n=1 Tax=Ambrosiozyma monospora TaxID=43982 RepID=A0ACB5U5A8_AMBMO|nr:unnamed protein product [Ambrosiozyma monospora]